MQAPRLVIQIFGPPLVRWADGRPLALPGAKQRALIVLLATAPGHARSRGWLQSLLWSEAEAEPGRASLRQALSQIRRALGPSADAVIRSEGDVVALVAGAFELTGDPDAGEFLEGLDIAEEGFEDWLREMRSAPPVAAVARPAPQDTPPEMLRIRPKIAVLPFLQLGNGPDHTALGDALAQELTRVLSRSQLIDMVAHLSCRVFDPRHLDTEAVRRRLDADYLVTGRCSLRGERALIDVDFTDLAGESLIWTERTQIEVPDFLAGEADQLHDIARKIVGAVLAVSVDLGVTRPLPSVAAHALMMSSVALIHHMSEPTFRRAREQLDEVVRRAPCHSIPRAWRAQWHLLRIFQAWSDDPRSDRARAEEELAAALDLNPECAFSLSIDGNVKTVVQGAFDAAAQSFDRALLLNPSSPLACQLKSVLSTWTGNGAEAVALAERARRLSPCDPRGPFFDGLSAAAYLVHGQHEMAVALADRSLRANPRHLSAHRSRVIGLVRLGRMQEARLAARDLLRQDPDLTVARYRANHVATRTPVGQGWADALAEAGVPRGA